MMRRTVIFIFAVTLVHLVLILQVETRGMRFYDKYSKLHAPWLTNYPQIIIFSLDCTFRTRQHSVICLTSITLKLEQLRVAAPQ